MTNGSANFRARQRIAHKIDILLKLQDVLIDLLDDETYYDEWCAIGLPDGMGKEELINLYEDSESELSSIYCIAIDLLRECEL